MIPDGIARLLCVQRTEVDRRHANAEHVLVDFIVKVVAWHRNIMYADVLEEVIIDSPLFLVLAMTSKTMAASATFVVIGPQ